MNFTFTGYKMSILSLLFSILLLVTQTTMPGNKSRDVLNLENQLITTILKLLKHNIPVFAFWFTENEIKQYGTKNLKELIGNVDKLSIDSAVKLDVLNLTSPEPDEPLLTLDENIPVRIRAKQFCQPSNPSNEPDVLPFPLNSMNRKQKITWITKQILQEQRNTSKESMSNVNYGDPELQPSFWLDEAWILVLVDIKYHKQNVHWARKLLN